MKAKLRKSGVFWYFLVTYVAILIIPSIALGTTNYISAKEFEDNLISHNMLVISAAVDTFDILHSEIQNTAAYLQGSKMLLDLVKTSSFQGPNNETLNLLNAMKELNNIKLINNNIQEILLYSNTNGSLMTTKDFFVDPELFYSDEIFQVEGVSRDEFQQTILLNSRKNSIIKYNRIHLNRTVFDGYLYYAPLPVHADEYRSGTVILCLGDTIFSKALRDLNISERGMVQVVDGKGVLYYQKGNMDNAFPLFYEVGKKEDAIEFVQNGTKYLCLWKKSEETGLIYSVYIPKDFMMEQTNTIRRISLFMFLFSLCSAIGLAMLLSDNNAKPIQDLLATLSSDAKGSSYKRTLRHLKGNIDSILTSNVEIETRLKSQLPLVRTAAISSLLNGSFESREEVASSLMLADVELKGHWQTVVIVRFADPLYDGFADLDYDNKVRILITDIILSSSKNFVASAHEYVLGRAKVAFIFSFTLEQEVEPIMRDPKKNRDHIEQLVGAMYRLILEETGIKIVATSGESVADLQDISTSFDQAKQAMLSVNSLSEQYYYYFNDITNLDHDFYYPFDLEQRISSAIRSGNGEKLDQLLRIVYVENFIKKQLNATIKVHLLHTLYTTLIRSVGELSRTVNQHVFLLHNQDSFDDGFDAGFDRIMAEYHEVCALYSSKIGNANDVYRQQIVSYIDSQHSNSEFTIDTVAQKFGVSERTFYQYFRNTFPDSFTVYLEKLRIEKAKLQLLRGDISVDRISDSVGYSSIRSFQRAFKRVVGVSPNEYRNQHQL